MEGRQAGRQKSAPPLVIPVEGDADRKRILNILAQRRYRQRKREKFAALERTNRGVPPLTLCEPGHLSAINANLSGADILDQGTANNISVYLNTNTATTGDQHQLIDAGSSTIEDSGYPVIPVPTNIHSDQTCRAVQLNACNHYPDKGTAGSESLNPVMNHHHHPPESPLDFMSDLANLETSQFTFPDDKILDVPILNVLQTGSQLASFFGCQDTIWDITASRTLDSAIVLGLPLTPNLEPTAAQLTIPHHPIFDILPWPSMRTKLITIFSLPAQARPVKLLRVMQLR